MDMAFATYSSAQTNTELVAAQAGKIIRVTRLVFTSWVGVKLTLVSDPGGSPSGLTPPLHISNGRAILLNLGRGYALTTARGKALGITTAFLLSEGEYSVVVWYDVVA